MYLLPGKPRSAQNLYITQAAVTRPNCLAISLYQSGDSLLCKPVRQRLLNGVCALRRWYVCTKEVGGVKTIGALNQYT